jgi:hypothetical protein
MACPDDDTFARFVEGGLPQSESAAIERHVDGCARCADLAEAFGRLYARRPAEPPNAGRDSLLGLALVLSSVLHVAWAVVVARAPDVLAVLAPTGIAAAYRTYAMIWGRVGAGTGLLAAFVHWRGWRGWRGFAVVHAVLALPSIILTPLAAFVISVARRPARVP